MRSRRGDVVAFALACGLALLSAAPIAWIVVTSFKTFVQSQAVPPVFPDLRNVRNYVTQFGGAESALPPLLHSLVVATAATILTVLLAVPAAYALARYPLPRKNDVQFWILSTRFMPLVAGVVPLSALLSRVGLGGSLVGLTIVYVSINLSFAVWLLTVFFRGVPESVEEAARIDGATRLAALRHVVIPAAAASIGVVALFTWIFSRNELLDALVLTDGASRTLPVFLARYAGDTLTAWQNMAAVATVQTIPAVLVTFLAQRSIVAGLSMGAISAE